MANILEKKSDGIRRSPRKKDLLEEGEDLNRKKDLSDRSGDLKRAEGGVGSSSASSEFSSVILSDQSREKEDKISSWFSKQPRLEGASGGADLNKVNEEAARSKEIKEGGDKGMLIKGIIGGVVFLVIVVWVLSTIFARATITIKPKIENIEIKDVVLSLDTSITEFVLSKRAIPAIKLEFTKRSGDKFEATGKKFVEKKAVGQVKIYNKYSSSPQPLVKSTRFLTESGILYRLTQSIVIPGAKIERGKILPQYIETELSADKPGDEANIKSVLKLSIPGFQGSSKYGGFYATAEAGFQGGFRGEAKVVSKEDIKRASEVTTKVVYADLEKEVLIKTPPDFKTIDSLRRIEITKVSTPPENTPQELFTVEAQALAQVFLFREKEFMVLLREIILGKDTSREVIHDSVVLDYSVKNIDFIKGRATILVNGNARVKSLVNEEEVKNLVRNKKEGSIVETIKKQDSISSFRISFFPPWLFKAPADSEKIKIVIE